MEGHETGDWGSYYAEAQEVSGAGRGLRGRGGRAGARQKRAQSPLGRPVLPGGGSLPVPALQLAAKPGRKSPDFESSCEGGGVGAGGCGSPGRIVADTFARTPASARLQAPFFRAAPRQGVFWPGLAKCQRARVCWGGG